MLSVLPACCLVEKGLHLLVTFVNIKDIKALFICNPTGHNNKKKKQFTHTVLQCLPEQIKWQ